MPATGRNALHSRSTRPPSGRQITAGARQPDSIRGHFLLLKSVSGCVKWEHQAIARFMTHPFPFGSSPGIDRPAALGSIGGLLAAVFLLAPVRADERLVSAHYQSEIKPLLAKYCGDCHLDGERKGNVAFDAFPSDAAAVADHELWLKSVKNLRAGLMPPGKKPRPSPEEIQRLEAWIKYEAFGTDPHNPDPGRITIHRLNRSEYRNTILDLMGYDFPAENEFPPDDTGYGFDNIGDVLTLSPMLLEKYLAAAKTIVTEAVPVTARVPAQTVLNGSQFVRTGPPATPAAAPASTAKPRNPKDTFSAFSYYEPATAEATVMVEHDGQYQVTVEMAVRGTFDYDPGRCRVALKIDGTEVLNKEFGWYDYKVFRFTYDSTWKKGEHRYAVQLEPLVAADKKLNSLDLRLLSVTAKGPSDPKYWVRPKNYDRFFPQDVPAGSVARRRFAREVLRSFAMKAYRKPVEEKQVQRLVKLAENTYTQPGKSFESGIAQALIAVLASPHFLFRLEESAKDTPTTATFAPIDEYSLASRLSYFLWSTLPDAELFQLARDGALRRNLGRQVQRMLADPRSEKLIQNFTGQWLQTRDVTGININARVVLARDDGNERQLREQQAAFRAQFNRPATASTNRPAGTNSLNLASPKGPEATNPAPSGIQGQASNRTNANPRAAFSRLFAPPRVDLDSELRSALQQETDLFVGSIFKENRSITELLQSDYTFLNERLAKVYGLTNLQVVGPEMRRVNLPADSVRGGILTQGSVLVVTSNPDRTSPVKRGLFVLDNILGTPAPPPPPNIPSLEAAEKDFQDRNHEPTLREVLAVHREKPLCASCHNRMDPIGLAFENFNALGMSRDKERNQLIETSGRLITGEEFQGARELKQILVTQHRQDFYRCLTEKLLTYALGRGLEYYDLETVDQIVARLNREDGRSAALLLGVIESAPFQQRRTQAAPVAATASRADAAPRSQHRPNP